MSASISGSPIIFSWAFSSRQPLIIPIPMFAMLWDSRLCSEWAAYWFSPSGRSDSTSKVENPFSQYEHALHTVRSPSFHKSFHVFLTNECPYLKAEKCMYPNSLSLTCYYYCWAISMLYPWIFPELSQDLPLIRALVMSSHVKLYFPLF